MRSDWTWLVRKLRQPAERCWLAGPQVLEHADHIPNTHTYWSGHARAAGLTVQTCVSGSLGPLPAHCATLSAMMFVLSSLQ